MKLEWPIYSILLAVLSAGAFGANRPISNPDPHYEIAVYYWPSWHADPLRDLKKGRGWTEWELVKAAQPKFPGHQQPKVPLWGYRDESDPKEMARSVDAMADHGITTILFDWYRFEGGAPLEAALASGFLQAPNRHRLKFALMWANEALGDTYPYVNQAQDPWLKGEVSRPVFDRVAYDAVRYFGEPNYWKVQGKPYFSIYVLQTLMSGLGGLEETREALESFRARAKAAGFSGVHINAISYGLAEALKIAKGKPMRGMGSAQTIETLADLADYLGIDSVTWYTWAHVASPKAPTEVYEQWARRSVMLWPQWQKEVRVPFFPNVTLGWDGTPRQYPGGIVVENSPAVFRDYLEEAKRYLDSLPADRRVLMMNAWNEWPEGSYLEPEKTYGMQYLEAIRDVFGSRPARAGVGVKTP